ncbi:hypothetical protein SAMN05443662_0073 [Sulfurivirga caldicuralii]|uniref:Uncharacterized protein n=1 Tax=Sulfurivirga caldicuralii TaxID=364032 RepID=A0A1N6DE77_9GAMM|nr:hypothetical protein [Sulfurivirga caldicuralii]SIN69027.1 hypothetical protein SAMN05443662_0073 [Sulfurivirga caldicuralii]
MQRDRAELNNLRDLDRGIIETIAKKFIQQYGDLDPDTGKPVENPVSQPTMEKELQEMLNTPELGLRQVVPLIVMWVDEFQLDFNDELFDMEKRRLERRQQLVDELEKMAERGEAVTLEFTIGDILTELELREIPVALPYLEAQLFKRHGIPPEPQTLQEAMERLRDLWAHADQVVQIILTPEEAQQKSQLLQEVEELFNTEDDYEHLKEKARAWLKKTQQDHNPDMQEFLDMLSRESLSFQMAIREVMDEEAQAARSHVSPETELTPEAFKLLTQKKGDTIYAGSEYTHSYNFFRRLLTRLVDWWIFRP